MLDISICFAAIAILRVQQAAFYTIKMLTITRVFINLLTGARRALVEDCSVPMSYGSESHLIPQ